MSLFHSKADPVRFGIIVEIGSGSVLVAIVRSEQGQEHPDILWSEREYIKRRTEHDLTATAKDILTSLMNAVLMAQSQGKTILESVGHGTTFNHIQVSITAPWSYTITKVISYNEEDTFTITHALIQSLMDAAQKKIIEELKENELASDLGLTITARATTDIQANDYKIQNPVGQHADTLTLTQVSAVTQTYLTEALEDIKHKVFPHVTIERYSFMLIYHCIIRDLHEHMTEYCLVDITDEATEIGIVRGGILKYCTHTAIGIGTLARSIAETLSLPIDEAYSFMKEPNYSHALSELSPEKRSDVELVLKNYQQAVTDIFHETGDALSIPKVLFLHGGFQTEEFFTEQIGLAAKAATNATHNVHPVTAELLTEHYTPEQKQQITTENHDTAVLVAAAFFHKQHHCNDFVQV
jgi:cell division ATPase FtsA